MNDTKNTVKRLRDCPAEIPLVSPYTKGHKAGDGKATFKTATAAAKAAQTAQNEAEAAQKAAEAARDGAQRYAKQVYSDKVAVSEMLEEHAAEVRKVCARAVAVCALLATVQLVLLTLVLLK